MEIGKAAPAFSLTATDGSTVKLSDYRGKWVALYFYPKDDTPGCTAEACNLRDNYAVLQKAGVMVLGVSKDDRVSHQKFTAKHKLPFPLLVDDAKVCEAYGAWGEKSIYGKKYIGILRKTFLIDPAGKIARVIDKVDTERHAEQIMEMMSAPT